MTTDPAALTHLGGKGANLLRLADAGLPVPPFVVVDTDEYRAFVTSAGLSPLIEQSLKLAPDAASARIRAGFDPALMDAGQRARIVERLGVLADGPVAVRSSATAEDLPGLSFAGQHDTVLDVAGPEAVLEAVVTCWSSLWTERAISYRAHQRMEPTGLAMAVVVQRMVPADASGVLFTANPRTGRRGEYVVDAVPGLGEELVSGRVTPTSYVLDRATGRAAEAAGTGHAAVDATGAPVLSDDQLGDLATLGRRIEEEFGSPQDIEWARVGDLLFVVQSRPITSLYPLPAPDPAPAEEPLVWFSFGAFQGMLEPLTPLGADLLRMLLSAAPRVLGRRVDWRTNSYVQTAGLRLWLRVDGALRTRMGRKALFRLLPLVDPGLTRTLKPLAEEPGLHVTRSAPLPRTLSGLAGFASRVAPRARAAALNPPGAREHLTRVKNQLLSEVATELERAGRAASPQERLAARRDAMETIAARLLPLLLPAFAPIMVPSLVNLARLRAAARRTGLPDADALALNVLRALPGNVTVQMDLALADTAATIRADATAWGWVAETPASDLADQYLAGNLPVVAQEAIAGFLSDYGMRGVAEIDLGAPRWRDDPEPVMHTLKAYVATTGTQQEPRARHKEGQHEAGRSIRKLMDASRPAQAQRIRVYAQQIRGLFGARETPKFTIIRAFGLLREALDASARELVEAGRIDRPADLYYLRADELRQAFGADWHQVVAGRRAAAETEARRPRIPRLLVSDGRAFYEGLATDAGDLRGAGVSPGVATGPVQVVVDPRTTRLEPGAILVCRGTDPAWTPLFLSAAGLITEVGGLMTHGSVVAREYGLPAVVGVSDATTRLRNGQRIRLDGTSGAIEIL